MEHLAGGQVADFKPEQLVYIHEAKGLLAVDSEGPNEITERTNLTDDLVVAGVRDTEERRFQTCQISVFAVEADDGVVGAGFWHKLLDHVTRRAFHDVPVVLFERGQVDESAVRRNRHSVAPPFVGLLPKRLLAHRILT